MAVGSVSTGRVEQRLRLIREDVTEPAPVDSRQLRLAREAGVPYKIQLDFIRNRVALSRPHRQPLKLRRSRLLALPLVLLCALAYLGSAAHFAFVQHSVCLEHGESVHADEVRPAAAEASFADSRIAATRQVAQASHGTEAHCVHTFCRREALPPPSGALVSASAPPVSGPVLFADVVLAEPVARLRLAPKSSPPRV